MRKDFDITFDARITYYLSHAHRDMGTVIIGGTRRGKSTFLLRMIEHDINITRTPVIVMDAHEDLINDILSGLLFWKNATFCVPEDIDPFANQDIYLLRVDENQPFGLNLYECNNLNSLEAVQNTVDNVMSVFKRVFAEEKSFYPRIERILRATAHIIVMNQLTMAEIPYLFVSREFRNRCMEKVTNPQVHQFWYDYDRLRPWEKSSYLEGAIDRLNKFLSNDLSYRIVSQRTTTVPFKQIFTSGGNLLVQLPSRNRELANFLRSVFLAILSQVAWEQQKLPKQDRRRIHLYLDEYGRFSSTTSASLLKEGGKLNLGTVIAHQTLSDLIDEENRQSELQAGNLILFKLTGDDSEVLVKNLTVPPEEPKIDPRVISVTREPLDHIKRFGHKDPEVEKMADVYLRPLEEAIIQAKQNFNNLSEYDQNRYAPYKKFVFNEFAKSKTGHAYDIIQVHSGYCAHIDDLKDGEKYLNTLLYNSMNHPDNWIGSREWNQQFIEGTRFLQAFIGLWGHEFAPRYNNRIDLPEELRSAILYDLENPGKEAADNLFAVLYAVYEKANYFFRSYETRVQYAAQIKKEAIMFTNFRILGLRAFEQCIKNACLALSQPQNIIHIPTGEIDF